MKRRGRVLSEALRGVGLAFIVGGVALGCARASSPPGGPPDELPPFLVETSPDTFAIVEGWDGPVVFRFSERISERPAAGTWVDAVTVSPESGPVEVRHRRDALEIRPAGGFRSGQVYRISLKPVVRDLFGNVLFDPFELVFSTGPAFDEAVLAGLVWDRITGEGLRDHRVEAVASSDTGVVHLARTDSTGIFTLRYLPPGQFQVTAYQDRNRNRTLDPAEPRGREGTELSPVDTVVLSIPVLAPDTTPALLASADLQDTLSIRLSFDDALDPASPTGGVTWEILREVDSIPILTGRGIFHSAGVDSLRSADRIAAGQDPLEDTVPSPRPGGAPGGRQAPRTTTPDGRPLPERTLFLVLSTPLEAGQGYLVEVENVTNIHGIGGGGGRARLVLPAPDTTPPPAPDTVADTLTDTLRLVQGPGAGGPLRPRVLRLSPGER
jgi:hypothetical protein